MGRRSFGLVVAFVGQLVLVPALRRPQASPVAAAPAPVVVSPAPGSVSAGPRTQISFLGRPLAQLGTIEVTGSLSGPHAGRLLGYSTGDGASFLPDAPFLPGETVMVKTTLPVAGSSANGFSFHVAKVVPLVGSPHPPPQETDVLPGGARAGSRGSVEQLPRGDLVVGWGTNPHLSR